MDGSKIPIISNLPPELIFYILSFLSLKDLNRAGNVDRQFNHIVQDCRRILSGSAKGKLATKTISIVLLVQHGRILKKFIKGFLSCNALPL
jgi:hypothetical protein